jgi:DNA-binding transcriptional LysR family regulator
MNQIHLAAFLAVAETGSFVRGARRLMVGQPAVSSHVADLEMSLKVALFERLPRGVRLTEAGTVLLGYARQMAAMENEAEQAVANLRGVARGRLRIGASTTVGAYLMPPIIARFKRQYPGVELVLDVGNAAETQKRLLDAALDFSATEGFVESPALSAEKIFQDQLLAIAPPDHPLLRKSVVTAKMLEATMFLLREPGSGTREVVERALEKKRIVLQQSMSIGSTEAIKQAVIAGLGVAIVSGMTIQRELVTGALRVISISDLQIDRPILLTTVKGRPLSSATNAFLPMLRSVGSR